jgi:MFS family permease
MNSSKRRMLLSSIAGFNTAFSFMLVSSFLPIYLANLEISLMNIGFIFAFGAMIAGVLRFPIGTITDKVGRRPLMLIGAIGYPIFAIGTLLSRNTAHFVSIKLLIELFGALFWTAFWAYIYDILRKGHEGRQLAYTKILAIGVSGALAPFIGGFIIAYYGFTSLFYLAAAVGVVNIFFIATLIRDYLPPIKESAKHLEKDIVKEYRDIINIKKFRIYLAIGVLHNIIWATWYVYMPIYLSDMGISIQQIGIMISLLYISYIITTYPLGKLIDKFPSKYLIIPGFFLMWFGGYMFFMFKDFARLTLSRMAIAVGFDATWEPMIARLSHITSEREHGGTVGLFRAGNAIAIGLSTVVVGYFAGIYGIKAVLWGVSTFSLIIGIILVFINTGLMGKGRAKLHKHHVMHLQSASGKHDKSHH